MSPIPLHTTQQLKIYNSTNGSKEIFLPINEGHIGMYVCGPTVYSNVHLGNCRTFISFDLIFRYLKHLGYKVRYVRNITDAGHLENDADSGEDKVAKKARLEQLEPMEIVQRYTLDFHTVLHKFNTLPPSIEPTATGHIIEQIEIIKTIIENGFAYVTNGSVYFDVEKFNESPWSDGFPGWHLECTAMSTKYLGEEFDIHGGGMDLKFPHHECEIAQGEAACGKTPVRYWMHANMLTLNGKKMSKSTGNTIEPAEIFSGNTDKLSKAFAPTVVRFFILQAHYRSILDFSNDALEASEKGFNRLMKALRVLPKIHAGTTTEGFNVPAWKQQCYDALNDDFNSPIAIAKMFDAVKFINSLKKGKASINAADLELVQRTMTELVFDVLGLVDDAAASSGIQDKLTGAVELLINLRAEARTNKDFATSDKIRDELLEIGIQLKDGRDGTGYTLN